jgi:hypothetical protein
MSYACVCYTVHHIQDAHPFHALCTNDELFHDLTEYIKIVVCTYLIIIIFPLDKAHVPVWIKNEQGLNEVLGHQEQFLSAQL